MNIAQKKSIRRISYAAVALAVVAGLAGCGKKEQKSGQALVSVNGEEITALQLNEELQRSGVPAAQQEAASKQLLEALIDRQLLENEAERDKTDRDPKVVQAIERAKALIIAQAYMQKRLGAIPKPTKQDIADYFEKHPEFFTHRKQFDMRELIIATRDLTDQVKKALDSMKTVDDMASWLDSNKVKYARNQVSRTTADLAPELGAKLLAMPKGQLFIIREGERSMLISVADVKEVPVDLDTAAPQIEQYLINTKSKEAAAAELARLRASAKIEYLNKALASKAPAPVPAPKPGDAADANVRGVAGLK